MKLLVIIPAYNEGDSIVNVVQELQKEGPYDYVIINDGSKDHTAEKIEENAFPVINLPENIGLSGVVHVGMNYALEHGYDAVLQFDGDGQHRPEYIKEMKQMMEQGDYDIVIGSRDKEALRARGMRGFGNRILSKLIHWKTGGKITDSTSGMRMYGLKMLKLFRQKEKLQPEPYMLAIAVLKGFKIGEVKVTMRERQFGESYFNFWRSVRYMTEQSIAILFVNSYCKPRKNKEEQK